MSRSRFCAGPGAVLVEYSEMFRCVLLPGPEATSKCVVLLKPNTQFHKIRDTKMTPEIR